MRGLIRRAQELRAPLAGYVAEHPDTFADAAQEYLYDTGANIAVFSSERHPAVARVLDHRYSPG